MIINLRYRLSVIDAKGKIKTPWSRWKRSHSFVKNFMVILQAQLSQVASVDQVHDYSGSSYNVFPHATNLSADMPVGDYQRGIIFGRDAGTITMLSWQLSFRYSHGNTENKLFYNIGTYAPLDVSTSKTYQLLTRTATNTWTGTQTVREVGIDVRYLTTTWLAGEALIVKDIISPIILAPGETIQCQYEIEIAL